MNSVSITWIPVSSEFYRRRYGKVAVALRPVDRGPARHVMTIARMRRAAGASAGEILRSTRTSTGATELTHGRHLHETVAAFDSGAPRESSRRG